MSSSKTGEELQAGPMLGAVLRTIADEVECPGHPLVEELEDAAFDCGSWRESEEKTGLENVEAYRKLLARLQAARRALIQALSPPKGLDVLPPVTREET